MHRTETSTEMQVDAFLQQVGLELGFETDDGGNVSAFEPSVCPPITSFTSGVAATTSLFHHTAQSPPILLPNPCPRYPRVIPNRADSIDFKSSETTIDMSTCIMMDNLSPRTTLQELAALLGEIAPVTRILEDGNSTAAFFACPEEALAAMERFHSLELHGHVISVTLADLEYPLALPSPFHSNPPSRLQPEFVAGENTRSRRDDRRPRNGSFSSRQSSYRSHRSSSEDDESSNTTLEDMPSTANKPPPSERPQRRVRLFIGFLPPTMNYHSLMTFLSSLSVNTKIDDVVLTPVLRSIKPGYFAHVTVDSEEVARKFITSLDGYTGLSSNPLTCARAKQDRDPRKRGLRQSSTGPTRRIDSDMRGRALMERKWASRSAELPREKERAKTVKSHDRDEDERQSLVLGEFAPRFTFLLYPECSPLM